MTQSLLSERTVRRWVRAGGNQHKVAGQREQALYDRLKTTLGPDTAFELEDVVVGWIEAEQARVLTYVGTVLQHSGRPDLWQQVYDVVTDTPVADEHQHFLEQQMAAVRASHAG